MRKAINKKTHEYFVLELIGKGVQYKPIDRYIDSKTKIRFECPDCGNVWMAQPSNILCGKGCPKCRDAMLKKKFEMGKEEFCDRVQKANPNTEIVSTNDYTYHGRSLVRCKIHGGERIVNNANLIKGCGCKQCGNEKTRKLKARTQDEFVSEVAKTSPHIEVLGEYINARTKIKVRCKNHNEIYYVTPDLLINGTGNCSKCTMTSGEYKVANYLDAEGYEYIPQYSFDGNKEIKNKRYDFYIPSLNTCIEYDGKQHFEPLSNFGGEETFEYTQKCDAIKNAYCKEQGINLIRIPYTVDDVGEYLHQRGI